MSKGLVFGAVVAALVMPAGCAYDSGYPYGYGYAAADNGKVRAHSQAGGGSVTPTV